MGINGANYTIDTTNGTGNHSGKMSITGTTGYKNITYNAWLTETSGVEKWNYHPHTYSSDSESLIANSTQRPLNQSLFWGKAVWQPFGMGINGANYTIDTTNGTGNHSGKMSITGTTGYKNITYNAWLTETSGVEKWNYHPHTYSSDSESLIANSTQRPLLNEKYVHDHWIQQTCANIKWKGGDTIWWNVTCTDTSFNIQNNITITGSLNLLRTNITFDNTTQKIKIEETTGNITINRTIIN